MGKEPTVSYREGRSALIGKLLTSAFVAAFALAGAPALAQDQARLAQGEELWKRSGCTGCHGQNARGGDGGEQPAGPNLRTSSLSPEEFRETIACGRPGTEMPYNLENAYTEVSCYGIPPGEVVEGVRPGAKLTTEQLDVLVEYLLSLN